MNRLSITVSVSAACAVFISGSVFAAETTGKLEETLVQGYRESRVIYLDQELELVEDSAALLRKAPGANFNSNGPLSGIAQVRGMFGPRVNTEVNGQSIGSGGPNWMDPPLSYAPAAQLQSIEVYRGIAPVSAGQETIGGAVHATTWQGDFADTHDWQLQGNVLLGAKTVNSSYRAGANMAFANQQHRVFGAVLQETGDDTAFPEGDIQPTEFERQRYDLGYGFRTGSHSVQLAFAYSDTGPTGTPPLAMDIDYFESSLVNLQYRFESSGFDILARIYGNDVDHGMTNYHLRQAPAELSAWRQNIATAETRGMEVKIDSGNWSVGADYHGETHESDIDNPNNPSFFVLNFNQATRDVAGVFAEHNGQWVDGWSSQLGVRVNRVTTDSAEIGGTPANLMPATAALRDSFNAADRAKTDTNTDAVGKLMRRIDGPGASVLDAYIGIARKTRSPSYQERYLWLPMEATSGLADGFTYTGNIELKPEVAHELEFGFDFSGRKLQASPRLFYKEVSDYIQGTPSQVAPALMMSAMMNKPAPLHFNNVDARFSGFDMDMHYQIHPQLTLDSVVSYILAERQDIDDDLYRIAPLNGMFSLNYSDSKWGLSAESMLYAGQHNVSETQNEKITAGYGLFSLRGFWKNAGWQLSFGIENVFDKYYQNHLTGYNRVQGSDITVGERLPGAGRNIYARMDYRW